MPVPAPSILLIPSSLSLTDAASINTLVPKERFHGDPGLLEPYSVTSLLLSVSHLVCFHEITFSFMSSSCSLSAYSLPRKEWRGKATRRWKTRKLRKEEQYNGRKKKTNKAKKKKKRRKKDGEMVGMVAGGTDTKVANSRRAWIVRHAPTRIHSHFRSAT